MFLYRFFFFFFFTSSVYFEVYIFFFPLSIYIYIYIYCRNECAVMDRAKNSCQPLRQNVEVDMYSTLLIVVVMLGCDWGLRMVINITCFKHQEVVLYLQPLNTLA